MRDISQPPNQIRRVIVALIGAQVAIGVALMGIDLIGSWGGKDPLTAPLPSGPSTRPYTPDRRPGTAPGVPAPQGPMPERLELGGEGADLTLTGQIAVGDAARITEELRRRAETGQTIRMVSLDSTGGSVSDALEIGEVLRDSGIATSVKDGAICLSACPYLFAGGRTRQVAPNGKLGVHQHSFGTSAILPAFMAVESVQRGQAAVMAYLIRMGIDPAVMEPAMRTAPDRIYLLSKAELQQYGFLAPP
ncbi:MULTISPECIES: hypothetical protein [Thioclava]|uniref:Clp protease n=1 Tax=Thioclava litoralis TaxID=3076557 RepID=A0ABZ1DYZ1_9RHOB|nr:hypothetical protein RPE78_01490 [Thioclava sp. FTW29]